MKQRNHRSSVAGMLAVDRIIQGSRMKTSHSISVVGKELLTKTADKLGVNQSAALEIAIRKLAESEGVR